MTVSVKDLASFNTQKSQCETDKGTYNFMIGASVADIKAQLKGKVGKQWTKSVRNVLKPGIAINELKNK